MKKVAFVLLGLVASLATVVTATWAVKGDNLFAYAIPAGFGYGAYCAFRKVGRLASAPPKRPVEVTPRTEPKPRPWEH